MASRPASMWNIANLLSLGRVFGMAVAAVLYFADFRIAAVAVAAVSGITDLLDGWLARRLNQVSVLGATLDRLGDLVFEATALTVLCCVGLVPPWVLVAYQFREFGMLSVRLTAAQRKVELPSSWLGKLKTDFLCIGCLGPFLMHAEILSGRPAELAYDIGMVGIYIGLGFSFLSLFVYLRRASAVFRDPEMNEQ